MDLRWKTLPPENVVLLLIFLAWCKADEAKVKEIALLKIEEARTSCKARISNVTMPTDGGVYCHPIWDDILCWPDFVPAGLNATQPCPVYVPGFNPSENASRSCTESGSWGLNPDLSKNTSWTNFLNCAKRPAPGALDVIGKNTPTILRISTIGYSMSLVTLVIATAIMILFRKLHCQRNTIHLNLFISFMIRSIIALLKESLLVRRLALPSDVRFAPDGTVSFIQEGPHWECKLLFTLWQYSLSANYMWIFVEGLYLHTLIFFAVFSQSSKFFKFYIAIGWAFPLVFVIIWVMVRIFKDNTLCWNTHDMGFYWILDTPIIVSISINFFFFLNIIRVLFTKIRDCNTRDPRRYRKLARSTLVLIPLFGVYYIFFFLLEAYNRPETEVVRYYMEMIVSSFQGTIIALLFCFLNGEVRSEIKKKWQRHWLRRHSVLSGRSSRAFSTTSSYLGKDRASLSHQGYPLCDLHPRDDTCSSSPSNNNNNGDGGRTMHKVSSMPRLGHSSSVGSQVKPVPRVASTSRVSFTTTQEGYQSCSNMRSPRIEASSDKIQHGLSSRDPPEEDINTLNEPERSANEETRLCFTPSSDIVQGKELLRIKFKAHNEQSKIPQVSVLTGLPPLLDEVEVDKEDEDNTASISQVR